MDFTCSDTVTHPAEVVHLLLRDDMTQILPYLPDVDGIEVLTREDEDRGVRLVNLWRASEGAVPKVAKPFVKPEMLSWKDHALWNQNEWTCDWRVETTMFTENVNCYGHNTYVVDGEHTILQIRGELDVSLKGVPGVPKFLASKVAPQVEKLIVTLLKPNLLSVAKGLQDFLDAESEA